MVDELVGEGGDALPKLILLVRHPATFICTPRGSGRSGVVCDRLFGTRNDYEKGGDEQDS